VRRSPQRSAKTVPVLSAQRRIDRTPFDAFAIVRTVGLTLPDVEAATRYDGSPVLKLGGCFMAGVATHRSASLARSSSGAATKNENGLSKMRQETYYLTDYYRSYPLVLVRLSRIEPDALRDVLSVSWRLTSAKRRKR
jgi:hypothetical protein